MRRGGIEGKKKKTEKEESRIERGAGEGGRSEANEVKETKCARECMCVRAKKTRGKGGRGATRARGKERVERSSS